MDREERFEAQRAKENALHRLIAQLIAACVITLFLTIGGCETYRFHVIGNSADPLATSCAIHSGDSCILADRRPSRR